MGYDVEKLKVLKNIEKERFPLSRQYDVEWIIENNMGPNPLWFTEWVSKAMNLKPGMRVLDMGCGKVLSSIFLAKEYGVSVWANDLWVNPTENWIRIKEAGLENQVFPIRAEAHNLPYAEGFFDAVISIDSYQYYGTDDMYLLEHFIKLVKPMGEIGIVVPGLNKEFEDKIPEHLKPFWCTDMFQCHSAKWWKWHWEKTELVNIKHINSMDIGWKLWTEWEDMLSPDSMDAKLLRADNGEYMTWVRMIASRN